MSLLRWSWRLMIGGLVSLGVASCAGGDAPGEDPGAGEEGGEGGDSGGGEGGSKAGSAGKAGKGGKGGSSFPSTTGGAAGTAGASGASGASGGKAGSGGGFPSAAVGSPCTNDSDCGSKLCRDTGTPKFPNKICTQACDATQQCPGGTHCVAVDTKQSLCVADRDGQCRACATDADCANQGDRCLTGTGGEAYCAQDCAIGGTCPSGFECKPPPNAIAGAKACLQASGATCPCAPNRDKVQRTCSKKVGDKTCSGTESCNGPSGQFEGCSAPDPAPETCNGKDDDCDGKADNVPNGTCKCPTPDACTVECSAGFAHYPTTLPDEAGCPCAVDAGEPDKGSTCATALALTEISDAGAKTSITIGGTLSSDTDVDWYRVNIKDASEASTNSYHARISFETNPDNEFIVQVIRGTDCAQEASAPTLTVFEVCTNFQQGAGTASVKGQSVCAEQQDNVPKCSDVGSVYLIGVKRSAAAKAKTCSKYVLKIEGNAGPCDTSTFDTCGAQFGPKSP